MPPLPTGTVTFLFTDIAGSTALCEHDRDAMQSALAQHDALLRAAFDASPVPITLGITLRPIARPRS